MTKDEAQAPTPIKWTLGGEKDCCYDNWLGETPFGKILIIWKSWKDYPNACLVEFPGEFQANSQDQDDLKAECEIEFARRCKEALAQPEPNTTRPCRSCDGSGERFTGIVEAPTSICKPCDGTGQIAIAEQLTKEQEPDCQATGVCVRSGLYVARPEKCVCGEPLRLNIVHRKDSPCFDYIEREWVGLTDDHLRELGFSTRPRWWAVLEAKLKELNHV
jgi:hypothetical protein